MSSACAAAVAVHLWQSTLFAAVVTSLALLLRRNSARVRCSLWLAASVKFLIPFAALTALGARVPWSPGPGSGGELTAITVGGQEIARFVQLGVEGARALPRLTHIADYQNAGLIALGVLWAVGTMVVGLQWFGRWRSVQRALRESIATSLPFLVPIRVSATQLEPGVVGIRRPVLLLPQGMQRRLDAAEFNAVLAHERCHVARQDNLAASLHMLVETLFWFHPLVWWLGGRIVAERERACDEYVLAAGHTPATYAEGILKVCEHYLEAGVPCVAGIGGANLSQRIGDIVGNRRVEKMGAVRKLVISLAAFATVSMPIAMGALTTPQRFTAPASTFYLGPPRDWELRSELWLPFPDVKHTAAAPATPGK